MTALPQPQAKDKPAPAQFRWDDPLLLDEQLSDDEPSVRRLARLVLEKRGYRVLEAESAAAAMDLVGAHAGRLDLVLTDAVMPGLSGRSLLAHMASARPEARGVLMSGYSAEEVTESDRGPRPPFLQKPFAAADLLRKVREVLDAPPAAAAATL